MVSLIWCECIFPDFRLYENWEAVHIYRIGWFQMYEILKERIIMNRINIFIYIFSVFKDT